MFLLYDLIFFIFALIYLPYLLFRRKAKAGFYSRMGFLPLDFELKRPIWLHAVSVGEMMACRRLIEALRDKYPFKKIVLTTVTPTGNRIARGLARPGDFVFYLPLDLSFIVKKVIERINPSLFIIVETELWPNLISYIYKKAIPLILVNARISDRSFRGYLAISAFIKPILNKINLFCVQSDMDLKRLVSLGVGMSKIKITGNMKFDMLDVTSLEEDRLDYRAKLGLKLKERLFIAGSTHPKEEEMILNVYKKLINNFVDLRLLIAPRHPERSKEIEKIVIKYGFTPVRVSQVDNQTQRQSNEKVVFILDTIGELLSFYSIADIVFVGGSLIKKGGHNILEPAFFEKPILFGPHMFNFRDIARIFLMNKAAVLVNNTVQLYENIVFLLNNPDKARQYGIQARQIIFHNCKATERNLKWIDSIFSGT